VLHIYSFLSVSHPVSILDRLAAFRDSPVDPAFELHEFPRSNPVEALESKRERKRRKKLEQLREAEEMKFSHSLQFNAVPDWSNHYVAYSNLKKQYVLPMIQTWLVSIGEG
jgi:hypothetical protein